MTATVTKKETALPFRNDTILGVCEALGQEFGVNANWFRLAFVGPLFFQPVLTFAAYFTLGAIVAVARWAYPRGTAEPAATANAPAAPAAPEEEYKIAA